MYRITKTPNSQAILNKTGSLKTELLNFKIYNKIVAIKAA
jgi:hypothetical protein